jgi:hypothetical protein
MKKLFDFKNLGSVLLMLSIFASSCKQEDNFQSVSSKNEKSGKNGYLAFKDELKILKDAFTPLSNDPTLRRIVYKEVAKRFDGEDNVLIKTLIEASKKENYDLEGKLNKNMPNGQNVQSLLSSFIRKGKQRHAHLYIPSFEDVVSNDLKSGKGLNVRNADYPTLVSRPDNEAQLSMDGSMYDGSTYQTVYGVNESYSISNEVWVMSVNERVDEMGSLVYEEMDGGGGGGGPTPDPGNPTSTYGYCRNGDVGTRENLLGFKMIDMLEPWFDGGPEMRILPLDAGAVANLANLPANLRDLGESATLSLTINGFEGIFKRYWRRRQAEDQRMLYPDEFDRAVPITNHSTRVTIGGLKNNPSTGPTYNSTWEESSGKFFHWSLVTQAGANFNNLKAVTYILFEDDASGIFASNGEKVEIPIKLAGVTDNIVGDFTIKIPLDDDHDQAGSFIIPRENAPGVCNQSVFYTTGNWQVWSGWCKF